MMTLNASAPNKNNTLLYIILLVTLGLTAWTALRSGDEEVAIVTTTKINLGSPISNTNTRTNSMSPIVDVKSTSDAAQSSFKGYKRVPMQQPVQDLFAVHSWYVAPPVEKVLPAPPPKPTAPPLPFIYNGKLEGTTQGTVIFLMANNNLYTVIKGEKVDQSWRLDGESETSLRFTYLPLNLPKVLLKATTSNPTITNPVDEFEAQNNQPSD
ncbi:MAG: hypothetical protein WBP13_07415 [Methylophilaceae bacterium]